MKAMLWKELRENYKWAVLAMVGLFLAEIYGLQHTDPNDYLSRGVTTLCRATFLMATTFGCALIGLFLGFIQILPELRRDRWAFLIHRPVTRSVIFRGKVAAGILLYLLATVPPFLVCIGLVATPGHFGTPFAAGTLLPGLTDMFAGLVYYFAALFATIHRGSWFGARMLALFAAVHLSFFTVATGYFSDAVEASVLLGLVLFIAAWGAMLSNGSFHARPWLGKLALIVAVFYGLCGLGDLAQMLTAGNGYGTSDAPFEYYYTKEGVPLVVTRNADLTETVTDLQGHIINDDRYKGRQAFDNFLRMTTVAQIIGDSHGIDLSKRYHYYRYANHYVDRIEWYDNIPHPVQWFYMPDRESFIGMSNINKLPINIADRTGIKPWGSAPEPFHAEANDSVVTNGNPCLVNDGRAVFAFDFDHERMFQISSPDKDTIFGISRIAVMVTPEEAKQFFVLAMAHELRIYNGGGLLATIPYHQNVDVFGGIELSISPTLDRFFLRYTVSSWVDWAVMRHMPCYFETFDAKGNLLSSYDLPAPPVIPQSMTWSDYAFENSQSPAFWFGTKAYLKIAEALGMKDQMDRSNPHKTEPRKVGIHLLIVSLLLAPVTLIWARLRYFSWPSALAWAAFTFAFNIAGSLTFRLVADWPIQIPCPTCKRKRPVDMAACPHCHGVWPAPKRNGTEIFEEKPSAMQPVA